MINITLPDGKISRYKEPVDGTRVAHDISPSLAKKALAITVNGQPADLSTVLSQDASIRIITPSDAEGLEIIRHDAAHLLAQAVKRLYPDTQIVLGPVIKDGFYYDLLPTKPFSEEELALIEEEMRKISVAAYPIWREIKTRDEAIKFFESIGEKFKAKIIADIPQGEQLTLYTQGEFTDLCRGPHAPSTKFCKYFKLTKVSGSYWRGDSRNTPLQRIYGTAWATQEELDNYLRMLEEVERRDHRKLGKQLDLFHFQDEAPGAVFWHERGYTLYLALQNYIRRKIKQHGYVEVKTPILLEQTLWEKSGHWEKFRENMFVTEESDNKIMAIKPMNCPCHIQIFKQGLKSYRDLPLRMAEFGCCHRNEASGALHGLMRVREFVQDDAHIFCTEDQVVDETGRFVRLLLEVYKDLGFDEVTVKLSDRPDKRAGTDATWNKAEASLEQAIKATGLHYTINKGEGAFYGPKLEFLLRDAIGRDWQCGTLQVDFVLPERLAAEYVDNTGTRVAPVILHRAILGTLERFIGILIENCEGKFPLWLAPVQVVILPITDEVLDYATQLCDHLKAHDVRAILDASHEKIEYKIRKHSLLKVALLAIVGHREKENRTVTIRTLGKQEQVNYTEPEFYDHIIQLTRLT